MMSVEFKISVLKTSFVKTNSCLWYFCSIRLPLHRTEQMVVSEFSNTILKFWIKTQKEAIMSVLRKTYEIELGKMSNKLRFFGVFSNQKSNAGNKVKIYLIQNSSKGKNLLNETFMREFYVFLVFEH